MKLRKFLLIFILFNLIFTNNLYASDLSIENIESTNDDMLISVDTFAPTSLLLEADTR